MSSVVACAAAKRRWETSLSVLEVNPPLVRQMVVVAAVADRGLSGISDPAYRFYGKAVPDFSFTVETSELLIELLTVMSSRKLDASTG